MIVIINLCKRSEGLEVRMLAKKRLTGTSKETGGVSCKLTGGLAFYHNLLI